MFSYVFHRLVALQSEALQITESSDLDPKEIESQLKWARRVAQGPQGLPRVRGCAESFQSRTLGHGAMGHSMSQRSILFVRLMGNLHVLKVVKQYYSCTILYYIVLCCTSRFLDRSSLDCWICSQMCWRFKLCLRNDRTRTFCDAALPCSKRQKRKLRSGKRRIKTGRGNWRVSCLGIQHQWNQLGLFKCLVTLFKTPKHHRNNQKHVLQRYWWLLSALSDWQTLRRRNAAFRLWNSAVDRRARSTEGRNPPEVANVEVS